MRYCICGHLSSMHRNEKYSTLMPIDDNDCRQDLGNRLCDCYNFKLDNLKYLEECYDRTKNLA
jgi:hypothetical protein